jgi:tetratricopeptide (TPR) repeat protein
VFRISSTILFFSIALGSLVAQNKITDSLKLVLRNAGHDTTRCDILLALIEKEQDSDVWEKYNDQVLEIARSNIAKYAENTAMNRSFKKYFSSALNNKGFLIEEKGDLRGALPWLEQAVKIDSSIADLNDMAGTLNNIANINKNLGHIHKALKQFEQSLAIMEQAGNLQGMAIVYTNMGVLFKEQGDVTKAIDIFEKGLKIKEQIGDKKGTAVSFNNFAAIYEDQGHFDKALEYYEKSLHLRLQINDRKGSAICLNNIGHLFSKKNLPAKALEYYRRSLKLGEEAGDRSRIALALNNIGTLYRKKGDPEIISSKQASMNSGMIKALLFLTKSLELSEQLGDKSAMANTLNNLANAHLIKKDYEQALKMASRSMKYSLELGYPDNICNSAKVLSNIYSAKKDFKRSLENYELFIKMRDSVTNETTRKASIKNQLKYEYEKQAAADSVAHAKENDIKSAELSRQSAEIKTKKNQQYALFGGLFLVILFSIFMFNRYKITQKQKIVIEHQKEIVEEQKKLVEEKQKEILDSIRYAKRIQLAQIPSEKLVQKLLGKFKK